MINSNRYYRVAFLALFIILSFILTAFSPSSGVAYASDGGDGVVNFDNTDVLDDLEGSALNGVPFNLEDYPYDKDGELQILSFVEYCYSDYMNLRANYGLYLYLYNPALLDIATGYGSNKIQMGVEYDNDGNVVRWEKFDLKFCSVSNGTAANRFWKFKVIDHAFCDSYFIDRVSAESRRYDISGVEIFVYGEQLPQEYSVFRTYYYSGFAEGYGSTNDRLNCVVQEFEGIELEVQHTSYIANMTSNGHYNQVHTAYFAVPEYYFQNYGRLQKILCEWYEYQLEEMLVTSNDVLYDLASQYSGYQLNGQYDDYVPYWLWYGLDTNEGFGQTHIRTTNEWAYNIADRSEYDPSGFWSDVRKSDVHCNLIPLVFYSEVSDPYEIFEFLNKYKTAGSVTSNELLEAIYGYSNQLGHGYIDILERKLSSDLFTGTVDDGRILGYQQHEVDFDDTFDLVSYKETSEWIDRFVEFGLNMPDFGESYNDVRPIYEVQQSDLVGTNEQIARHLLINEADIDVFKDYYNNQVSAGNRVVLFRFAVTDYQSRGIGYESISNELETTKEDNTDSYICSGTVFFNFDIIQLTFNKDGEYRAFAVAADPIDIVGSLEPPYTPEWADDLENSGQAIKDFFENVANWFKEYGKWFLIVLGVIALIIVVSLFIKFFGLFTGGKTKVRIEMPKESGTVQNARKKKVGKTISSKKKK